MFSKLENHFKRNMTSKKSIKFKNLLFFILFLVFICIILIFNLNPENKSKNLLKENSKSKINTDSYDYRNYLKGNDKNLPISCSESSNYKTCCLSLFQQIRNPDKKLIFKPPLKEIPKELYDEFTQYGKMPLQKYWYFNDAYSDSDSNVKTPSSVLQKARIDYWLERIRKNMPLGYEDVNLQKEMFKYSSEFRNKSTIVIGTVEPWIESIAYELGSSRIVTLDYTRKMSEIKQIEWWHLNDYLDEAIQNDRIEIFDNAVSFSSIEHSGLGRFGDPLAPFGDFEAVQQVHCMLKKDGLFFLSIPALREDEGYILFNAGRVYGASRLNLIFKGWNVLVQNVKPNAEPIFVLQKI